MKDQGVGGQRKHVYVTITFLFVVPIYFSLLLNFRGKDRLPGPVIIIRNLLLAAIAHHVLQLLKCLILRSHHLTMLIIGII